jgi:hypothetical protein
MAPSRKFLILWIDHAPAAGLAQAADELRWTATAPQCQSAMVGAQEKKGAQS